MSLSIEYEIDTAKKPVMTCSSTPASGGYLYNCAYGTKHSTKNTTINIIKILIDNKESYYMIN